MSTRQALPWKLYDSSLALHAACRDAETAAQVVPSCGVITYRRRRIWRGLAADERPDPGALLQAAIYIERAPGPQRKRQVAQTLIAQGAKPVAVAKAIGAHRTTVWRAAKGGKAS